MSSSYLFTCKQCQRKRYCTPSLEDRGQTKAQAVALFSYDGVCVDCMLVNRSASAEALMKHHGAEYERARLASLISFTPDDPGWRVDHFTEVSTGNIIVDLSTRRPSARNRYSWSNNGQLLPA